MVKKPFVYLTMLALLVAAPAFAQRRFGPPLRRGGFVFVGGYFYDPFFGPYPWWSPGAYPYGYFPQYDVSADVRVDVKPKEAAVYVDGYYAGVVDDFDGFFQRLTVSPGQHELTLYLDGYRTAHEQLNLARRAEYKLRYQMERLPAGETSEKPALAPAVPPPPPGSYASPRTPPRGPFAPPPLSTPLAPGAPPALAMSPGQGAASTGTIVFRVQPGGAEVLIDGERWTSSDDERLVVQLSAGRHRVEIRKSGYRPLATDVDVRGGAGTPLNVSLSPE
jgi:hypothetical protein